MLHKIIMTFDSEDETLMRGHTNKSYWAEYFLVIITVNRAVQGGSNVWVCAKNSLGWPLK